MEVFRDCLTGHFGAIVRARDRDRSVGAKPGKRRRPRCISQRGEHGCSDEFDRGIRTYYFGFAALAWFVSAGVFIAVTLLILAVLYR